MTSVTPELIDAVLRAFVFLLESWAWCSMGFTGLMALAWITQQMRGDE